MADLPTRRAFARAALAGSLVALAVDLAMLLGPRGTLLRADLRLADFFDVQARALLDGHLSVPPSAVGFEGFVVDGRTYEYFGPVPALLRLPVLLVTHSLDGRLTQVAQLLALVLMLGAGACVQWRVRALLRPVEAVRFEQRELWLVALGQLLLGAGSVALFLAAQPVVYHETELWGAAWALAAVAAVLGVLMRPTGRRIALAGLLVAVTLNTRVSVGLGPGLALGATLLLPAVRTRRDLAAGVVAAVVLAFGSSAAVNVAKFRTPFGIPIDKQVASRVDPGRKAALAANDGTIFGRQFVPTTLLAAVRPDAVGTVRSFPYVGLPRAAPHVVGDVRFDTLQRSLSAPTSMTGLCLLAVLGLVALVRRRRWTLLVVVLALAASFVGALSIGYVTTRYLADALPFLFLGAAIGLATVRPRRAWVIAAGVLAGLGIVVNGGTGLVEQRLAGSLVPAADRAAFVADQDAVDRRLGRHPHGVTRAGDLPAPDGHRVGDLAVLGRCDGLYVLDAFGRWEPVERTARTGVHVLDVTVRRTGPVIAVGPVTVVAEPRGAGAALRLRVDGRPMGTAIPLTSRSARVVLSFDAGIGTTTAALSANGRSAGYVPAAYDRHAPVRLGPGARAVPTRAPVCERLLARLHLR